MSQQAKVDQIAVDSEPPLAAIRRERLDEQIVRVLVDAVIEGRWPAGTTLPPERELADQLEVNRTSLRQALARLEQMGLIITRQGSGNVVQDPAALTAPEVVRAMMRQLGSDLFSEILEVRTGLGSLIGRLAAERAEPHELASLRQALDGLGRAEVLADRQQAEMAFFMILVGSTHNRVLAALVRWVDATYGQLPDEFADAFADIDQVTAGLRRITEAVAKRRPAAASRAVEQYFDTSGARIVRAVQSAFTDQT